MAKRVRGAGVRSTHRPGGHAPVRGNGTTAARPATSTEPAAVAPAPERVAPAAAPAAPAVAYSRSTPGRVKVKPDSALAVNASTEYAYIRQDLRRIAGVAVGLFGSLVIIWFVMTSIDPLGLY